MLPKVSVLVITYNHERYIRQCLDGVLMQQVDFDYEIVIGEDRSTDNTGAIVEEYRQKYPDKIFVITPQKNQGGWRNFQTTIKSCRGKYIAYLDGDDYWTSPQKLQIQASMLDNHPEYAMCIHEAEILVENKEEADIVKITHARDFFDDGAVLSIADLITRNWFVITGSMMVRAVTSPPLFPDWAIKGHIFSLDLAYQLQILATTGGLIKYSREELGVYRIHAGGISRRSINDLRGGYIKLFKLFNKETSGKFWPFVRERMVRENRGLLQVNSFGSKTYLWALGNLASMGPRAFFPLIKHWIVINLVPRGLHRLYKSMKGAFN